MTDISIISVFIHSIVVIIINNYRFMKLFLMFILQYLFFKKVHEHGSMINLKVGDKLINRSNTLAWFVGNALCNRWRRIAASVPGKKIIFILFIDKMKTNCSYRLCFPVSCPVWTKSNYRQHYFMNHE